MRSGKGNKGPAGEEYSLADFFKADILLSPAWSVDVYVIKVSLTLSLKMPNSDYIAELHLCLQRKELKKNFDFRAP